jgi:DNA gyrase subunit A
MLISDQGTMVRTRGDEVSVVGRNTQGVRIIRLKDTENLVRLARIAEPEEEEFVIDDDSAEAAVDNNTAEGSSDDNTVEGSSSAEGSSDDTSDDSSADE